MAKQQQRAFPVKASGLFLDQHKRVQGLLVQLSALELKGNEMERGVLGELLMELRVHSTLDEELVYRLIEEVAPGEFRSQMSAFREQNREFLEAGDELWNQLGHTQDFRERLDDFADLLRRHFSLEKQVVVPLLENHMKINDEKLGERMEARRNQLLSLPEFREFRPENVQNPHGGEQKRFARGGRH